MRHYRILDKQKGVQQETVVATSPITACTGTNSDRLIQGDRWHYMRPVRHLPWWCLEEL